jgi:tRNA G18 (ribose-2'-O)-methylase SpoU
VTTNVAYGVHACACCSSVHPIACGGSGSRAARRAERLEELRRLAQQHRIDAATADAALLDRLADNGRHQGIVAELAARTNDPETDLEVALETAPVRRCC